MRKIFKPLGFADEGAVEICGRQIEFGNQQIELPANKALKSAQGVISDVIIGHQQPVGKIDVNKGQGHRVAADNPAAVGNVIFPSCGVIGKKCGEKPEYGHDAKTDGADLAGDIKQRHGKDGDGGCHAAKNIKFTQQPVDAGFVSY